MRGDERRQQLIEMALHLFATRGFRGTTTKSIAAAAGVSEAILFRHFPTKEDLYQALLIHKASEDGLDRTLAALQRSIAAGDDHAVVFQLAVKTLETYRHDADFQRVMLLAALEGHDIATVKRTLGLPVFALLRDYVERRQASGAFRAGDPALHVFALVALPMYFAIVTRLFNVGPALPADRKTAAAFADLILDGLRSRSSEPDEGLKEAPGRVDGARTRRAPAVKVKAQTSKKGRQR